MRANAWGELRSGVRCLRGSGNWFSVVDTLAVIVIVGVAKICVGFRMPALALNRKICHNIVVLKKATVVAFRITKICLSRLLDRKVARRY